MKTLRYVLVVLAWLGFSAASVLAGPPPVVQSLLPAPGTVGALTNITVTFSEPITGLTFEDLLINGGASASGLSGSGATWTFTLEAQPLYGPVQISWSMDHQIFDLDIPANRFDETAPSASWQYNLVDSTPPVVATLTPLAGVTVRQLSQIDVKFSELVAGVDAADLLINGAPATGLSVLAGGSYRFTFAQPTNGPVQVAWATNHNIRDFATAPNAFAGGALASYTLDPSAGLAAVRISEFLSSAIGASGLKDENNELQDWIEVHNFGTTTVNLAGYSLTDDQDDLGRWTFPATNLAPGQFLVVFASGKDRKSPGAGQRLHTNFRLNPFGDYLALFNADSPRVALTEFAPKYPEQRNDYSYGYDNSSALKYFLAPTPGAANGNSAIAGVVPQPHANVGRGFFDGPFTLLLTTALPGSTIRYTLDGSEPSGTNGLTYTGPLTITNTTILRAAGFMTNRLPSLAVTHTYIFLDSVIRQPKTPAGFPPNWGPDVGTLFAAVTNICPADYEMDPEIVTNAAYSAKMIPALKSLPSLSIVMNVEDMFGTNKGIYTHSSDSQTLYRGPAWERACSAEFILTNGATGFQVNCGIQIQGNASRNPTKQPKHPLRVLFKGAFGPSSLDYQIFPDSPVTGFDSLVLRSDFNSAWTHWDNVQRSRGSRIRDAWSKDTYRAMGGLAGHTRHFHLYLNGLYWGLYEFSEKPDADFAAGYLGGDKEEYDAIASKPTQAIDGDLLAYNAMIALRNLSDTNNYNQMLQYLDVTTFIDYMLVEFYGANQDWGADGNWNAVRRRAPDGRFKYVLWDAERMIENNNDNRVTSTDLPSNLHTNLLPSAEYKLAFADRAHQHLFNGGALTTNEMMARWLARASSIDPAIVAESARWGDYRRDGAAIGTQVGANGPYWLYSRDTNWVPEINRIATNYFPTRHGIFMGQLTTAGLYPLVSAPRFNQHGGTVARGFPLTMTASNTIYFTLDGSDPRVFGTGAISSTALAYSGAVTLTNTVNVKSRARSGTTWSAMNEATFSVDSLGSPLRITEIMYNPMGGDAYEFVEVMNVSGAAISVGYWSIDGLGQNNSGYIFPPNTTLTPGQLIVLASDSNPINWSNRYPGVTVFGRYSGKLDNGGERLGVRDANGRLIWAVNYDDEDGWPLAADGFGASLEIIAVFGDPDNAANWRASAVTNGTPGVLPAPPALGTLVLNEVMANNTSAIVNNGFYPDWVELYNGGPSSVNLANWSLTDDSNPRKFVLPSTTVPAGGYLVVWCDTTNAALSGLRAPFSLGANGDSVLLYDANTNRVDGIGFGIQPANHTIGRVGGAWTLTQPTTNATNIAVALASQTNLVINEWLANSLPGADDWVELFNRNPSAPVSLQGISIGINSALSQLNSLSFLAPGGFVQLRADGNAGPNHLNFNLPAGGETIVLYDAAGAERDRVTFSTQAQGVSQGRLPDGAANIVNFSISQSPGAANYLLSYSGPFLNEVLASNKSAATNSAGQTADFVELRNTNAASFSLAGYRLSATLENPTPWTFPAGVSVPANGFLVVWFDKNLPATTSAGAYQNSGVSLSADGDAVWLFNSNGVPVDSVAFGFQVANLPIGRSGNNWLLLASVSPGTANGAAATLGQVEGIRLNEWMAAPLSGEDWFELFNPATLPVALDGVSVADSPMGYMAGAPGLTTLAPLSFIGPKGFVKLIADASPSQGANHVKFQLDGDGEALRIFSPSASVIDTAYFGRQAPGVSQGRLPDGEAPILSFATSATPGESNYLPPAYAIINEVLTHTDPPLEDAVEIYNPSAQGADLGGWFLSNSADDLKKFRIPDGTLLPAGGFKVFYQTQFNSGSPGSFTLNSAHGDQLFLTEADGSGNVTGYRAQVAFGAAENGVAFGRLMTCNGTRFTALATRTFGQDSPATLAQFRTGAGLPNAAAKVGPVAINEIHYRPVASGTNENTIDEFIELRNLTATPVPLYDPAATTNTWRILAGVTYLFPATNVTLAANGSLIVVSFNPVTNPSQLAAFRAAYGVGASLPVFGPWSGKLDNDGEAIELYKPDAPQMPPHPDAGFVPYILADRVEYGVAAPWPVGAAGDGQSLQRIVSTEFGDDAGNWTAGAPTAGAANAALPATAPSITQHPYSLMAATNGRVVFSVTACGSKPFTYQWKKGGVNIGDATNAAFIIASAQPADAATYTVLVSNGAGNATGGPAVLSLGQAPTITSQPGNTNVGAGSPFTLSVTASGTAVLTYQWRLNGIPIPGATGAVVSVVSAQSADAGGYSVVVANGVGVASSTPAQVQIVAPLIITLHPVYQVVNPGTNVTFSTLATGSGTVRYQWLFNGSPIPGETNAVLSLSNVNLGLEGEYRCQMMDDVVTGFSNPARLVVRVLPTILIRPVGATNATGSSMSFYIECSGSVPMGFEWRQGTIPRTNMVLLTTNATFTIPFALPATSGLWRVVITNSGAPTATINSTFTVLVLDPPSITNQPVSRTVNPGTNVSFSVVAGPTNQLSYQWYFLNAPLAAATNATLNLSNVQVGNAGGYFVIVTNVAGSATSQVATLALNGPPVLSEPEYLSNGWMRFKISGVPNRSYFVDISSNLPNWNLLTNLLYTNGLMPFTDTTAPGVTNRFYRLRE